MASKKDIDKAWDKAPKIHALHWKKIERKETSTPDEPDSLRPSNLCKRTLS